jgi:hypothetical protein
VQNGSRRAAEGYKLYYDLYYGYYAYYAYYPHYPLLSILALRGRDLDSSERLRGRWRRGRRWWWWHRGD